VKKVLMTGVALMALGSVTYADGTPTTGNTLIQACGGNNDFVNSFCNGYLLGVADTHGGCMPAVQVQQIRFIFMQYLHNHPESWHLPGHTLVSEALRQTWPCKGENVLR
jgi:hypothetical protein